jgi:hypothetical protein
MKRILILPLALAAVFAGGAVRIVQDQCGPFTDVTPAFCPYILELYYLGITAGTSATTFSPDDPLTRGQGAVFTAKGLNQSLARSSRRAALGQWWHPSFFPWTVGLGVTSLPDVLGPLVCDGADVWVGGNSSLFRVRASDGKLLDTGKTTGSLLAAMGRIFVGGTSSTPGEGALYMIDPAGPASAATQVATLPPYPSALAFDGASIWTVNGQSGSVSIVTPSSSAPWPVTTVTDGLQAPTFIVFDGQSIWVSDITACALLRLDGSGVVTQTVSFGSFPCIVGKPVFDGANLLVPTGDSLQVVHATDGTVVATIPIGTGAEAVGFDGERILVERSSGGQNTPRGVTLLRAADFATLRSESFDPIGGPAILGIASDGLNFWVTLQTNDGFSLARY